MFTEEGVASVVLPSAVVLHTLPNVVPICHSTEYRVELDTGAEISRREANPAKHHRYRRHLYRRHRDSDIFVA